MRIVLILASLSLLVATSCSHESGAGPDAPRQVIATTSILGDVVAEVAGAEAEVTVLIPRGADPHEFRPSARQAAAIRSADLVVANGLGLEEGVQSLLEAAEEEGRLLAVAPELDPLTVNGAGQDPHVWLDPLRMAEAARRIGDRLAAVDSSVDWEASAEAYAGVLEQLHREIEAELSTIPAERRALVTGHNVLAYFADRYGFEVVGVIIPGGGTGAEASAQDIEALAREIERRNVPAIFGETTQPRRLAEALRAEAGVRVEVVELYTESLGERGSDAASYVEMMRTNVARIVAGLTG